MKFQDAYNNMVNYLKTAGSKITDFTSTSVAGQFISAIASVFDQIDYSTTSAVNQAYINTAIGTGLDSKGKDVGVSRKPATAAQWYFSFTKNQVSMQQIAIPQDTVITTIPSPGQSPITFKTNATAYLPAGTLNVTVAATCKTTGIVGNIATNTPLLIGSATPGIDGVNLPNLTNGTYGTDIETDTAYRARLLVALASKAQGTLTWYQQTALGVIGVYAVKVNAQGRGAGTVDIYIIGTNNALPSAGLITSVQAAIDAGRVITDDAKVFAPTAFTVNETLSIKVAAGYDLTQTGNLVQTAITNYINALGIGGGTSGAMYQSQVIAQALAVAGVLNATTANADLTFSTFQLPQAGTVTINTSY